jgi:hypothetical protein
MSEQSPQPFNPDPHLAALLEINRSGRLTRSQKNILIIGAISSSAGIFCILVLMVNVVIALLAGVQVDSLFSLFFFLFFILSFGYLLLTLYFNAVVFVPDAFSKNTVKTARGPLEIRMAARERTEMPYSYIVADYSFAPYMPPADVPMEPGREYVVYYAAKSRIFLNIEPIDSDPT